ncbi:hypothetical protein AVHM3334_13390 [Acidovorax sp. SUPP3334]|nr:hypothetical protein AVHM3334_13390 [Acidovorax sp. SUPP3334]
MFQKIIVAGSGVLAAGKARQPTALACAAHG